VTEAEASTTNPTAAMGRSAYRARRASWTPVLHKRLVDRSVLRSAPDTAEPRVRDSERGGIVRL